MKKGNKLIQDAQADQLKKYKAENRKLRSELDEKNVFCAKSVTELLESNHKIEALESDLFEVKRDYATIKARSQRYKTCIGHALASIRTYMSMKAVRTPSESCGSCGQMKFTSSTVEQPEELKFANSIEVILNPAIDGEHKGEFGPNGYVLGMSVR